MTYVAAALTALAVYFASGVVLDHLSAPLLDKAGWQSLEQTFDVRWLRAGAATITAGFIFNLAVRRRRSALLRWRKELAARARA
jgi:hypothetical protein